MDESNIEKSVRYNHQNKHKLYEEKKSKLNAVKSSTYENRRGSKQLISVIPFALVYALCYGLSCNGIINLSTALYLSFFSSKFIGDLMELVIYDNKHKDFWMYYKEMTESSKEKSLYSCLEEYENAKTDYYISEKENNNVINGNLNKIINSKVDSNVSEYKEKLDRHLKLVNKSIVLNKYLSDYKDKSSAIIKHGFKTALWTAGLCFEFVVLHMVTVGGITPLCVLTPAVIGITGFGLYNLSIAKAKHRLYKSIIEKIKNNEYYDKLDDLNDLNKKQNELINELGYVGLQERVNVERKSIKQAESKYIIKREVTKGKNNQFIPVEEEINDLEVSYGENSHAKILRKKDSKNNRQN